MDLFSLSNLDEVTREIQELYLEDERPWVIGYSGGKDSTAVVQLVFNALRSLSKDQPIQKKVYIISSDTLVETPLIIDYISKTLKQIEDEANKQGLPIITDKVKPLPENTFWVNLIGKGYPSPRQKFRWCTDRLKIEPANRFIMEKVSEHGEVILLLGVRSSESATRAQVMNRHTMKGRLLSRHSTMTNAYVYAPIRDFTTDDVWTYLLQVPSPWGSDNHELMALYQNSNAECPLVVDKTTASCGNSRFGCWVCTVVTEDKALKGFIQNGEEWLRPLLNFRNWLVEIRDVPAHRETKRINGTVYSPAPGRVGLGPFTLAMRKEILSELLKRQKNIRTPEGQPYELISRDELYKIQEMWTTSGDWENSVFKIYRDIFNQELTWYGSEREIMTPEQTDLLRSLCEQYEVPSEIVQRLLYLEWKNLGYSYRHGMTKELTSMLREQWLHVDNAEEVLE
ncbi:DNA phosphorothioation system sulfurtransferase DndC [Cohnella boryungensis]|uniref:DNA phosphorothioation system sulfurtransferase DndC n=1 Tax=Cohnella boryungensis TaxID=768479 RepID=A0ABV8SFN4_9BACL